MTDKLLQQIDVNYKPEGLGRNKGGLNYSSYNNFFTHSHILSQQDQLDPNAQQSSNTKSPMSVMHQQKEKIRKLMKFERIMKKLCRDIGVDKKTLFSIFMGPLGHTGKEIDAISSKNDSGFKNQFNNSRDSVEHNQSHQVNTGVAAQMAYNNIIPSLDPENPTGVVTQNQLMKLRNQGLKSRNNNYSLTESSQKDGSMQNSINNGAPQSQSFFEGNVRNSMNGGAALRNYDSETSIFADIRGNLNDNSFNEQMLEKNKIVYHQQNNSGQSLAQGKRTNSNEQIHHRPRSSKGNRSLVSAGNAGLFSGAPQSQLPQKFIMNKSDERAHKSQQQQRSLTGKGRNHVIDADTMGKILIQQTQQPQSQISAQQNLAPSKKSRNMTITGGDSQSQSQTQLQNVNLTQNSEGKKNRINIEDLKKYLISKDSQSGSKPQTKLQNLYLKQDDLAMMILNKKAGKGSKGTKIFSQMLQQPLQHQQQQPILSQSQQPILIAGPQVQIPQQAIYMNPVRPTSVGNSGAGGLAIQKKREKNKAMVQEFMMNNNGMKQNKQTSIFNQGNPLLQGMPQNHSMSVNQAKTSLQFFNEEEVRPINYPMSRGQQQNQNQQLSNGYAQNQNQVQNFSSKGMMINPANIQGFDIRRKSQPQ
ncbi:hypothetical protein FGO68_gene15257 [Halteria grandinella]|uniref:Uncharacterized protein n=1 Tax=Halteria grandinella TaxID=5974 RepID=A0A8J8P0I6_HALGN|nr:hypothetical protein FGO68_gene15257 [Halteria grandinella]